MVNKKKLLNEGEGEISLALIGLIMKKIKKVAFEVVYEKLLKEGDKRTSDFFNFHKKGVDYFKIENYENLLDLKKTDNSIMPTAKEIELQDDTEQIASMTKDDMGKEAIKKLNKQVKADPEDEGFFNSLKSKLSALFDGIFGDSDESTSEQENQGDSLQEQENEGENSGPSPTAPPPPLTPEETKKLEKLIYKYDPFKNTVNTNVFPYTAVEEYFIKKRTGLEKTYDIKEITALVIRAAKIYHHLKKIRLMIMKVQEASRNLKGQKIKDDEDEIKTIADILKEDEEETQQEKPLAQQDIETVAKGTEDTETDNLIKSFVLTKGKIGLNPFAIADELLYSVYGEENLKKFMKQAEAMHDELNEVSKYVIEVLKSRKLDASPEGSEEIEGVGELKGTEKIQAAKNLYLNKIKEKYKFKDKDGNDKAVGDNIIKVLDILASAVVKQYKPDEQQNNQEETG